MPFAGYKDFDECVNKNKDKNDPEAYCGKIKHEVEDTKSQLRKGIMGMTPKGEENA